MGISHADFYRIFPRVVAPLIPLYQGLKTTVLWPSGGRVLVTLSAERVRRIAALSLPYVDLVFEFADLDSGAIESFLSSFARSFHKGGG